MFAIHHCRLDERTRRYTTDRAEIAIGRGPGNDLLLADPTVAEHHCRVIDLDECWVVVGLDDQHGTAVNGSRIDRPARIREGDRIYAGAFVLELERLDARIDPVEADLLERIARGDDGCRAVYADWLEQRGEAERAEFVRLQQAVIESPMDTPAQKAAFVDRAKRLRQLAGSVDIPWRVRVARPVVEGCDVAFEIPCKMDWGALEPTDDRNVRMCNTCHKAVHYCLSENEAFDHADRGHCVVVDIRAVGLRCSRCDRLNPRVRACLDCGAALELQPPSSSLDVAARGMLMLPPRNRRRR